MSPSLTTRAHLHLHINSLYSWLSCKSIFSRFWEMVLNVLTPDSGRTARSCKLSKAPDGHIHWDCMDRGGTRLWKWVTELVSEKQFREQARKRTHPPPVTAMSSNRIPLVQLFSCGCVLPAWPTMWLYKRQRDGRKQCRCGNSGQERKQLYPEELLACIPTKLQPNFPYNWKVFCCAASKLPSSPTTTYMKNMSICSLSPWISKHK